MVSLLATSLLKRRTLRALRASALRFFHTLRHSLPIERTTYTMLLSLLRAFISSQTAYALRLLMNSPVPVSACSAPVSFTTRYICIASFLLAQAHSLRFSRGYYSEVVASLCHLAETESLGLALVVEHCGVVALGGGVAYSVYSLHGVVPLSFVSVCIIHHNRAFVNTFVC